MRIALLHAAVIVLAMSLFTPATCRAIDPSRSLAQLHHRSWTAQDGAPTHAEMMAQTDDGFLWFATSKGLVRFDGVRFERYVAASGASLPTAPIRSLLAIPGNGLLVGWFFGGATLLQDGRATHFGEAEGYPLGTTYEFVRERDGRLWAATSRALARYDGKRWERVGSDWNLSGDRAIALFIDRDGTIGAFTDSTLLLLSPGSRSFRETGGRSTSRMPIVQSPTGAYFYPGSTSIRSFAKLEDYDRAEPRVLVDKLERSDVRRLLVDRDGSLWFSTQAGFGRIADPSRRDRPVELHTLSDVAQGHQSTLFEDREGSVWVVAASGVDRFRASPIVPPVGPMRSGYPAMIADPDGGLWFAALAGPLHHASPKGLVREVKVMAVTHAHRDSEGFAWFASQLGAQGSPEVFRYKDGRFDSVGLPSGLSAGTPVQAIARDSTGALWISVIRSGVHRRDGESWTRPAQLPESGNAAAIAMTADSQGRLWLGYVSDRVARYQDGTIRIYGPGDGLDVGNVSAIHERNGRVWFGGERGISRFQGDRFVRLRIRDADVVLGITGIVETGEGDLWLHCVSGLMHIPASEVRKSIAEAAHHAAGRLFDDDDGLGGAPAFIRPMPTMIEGGDGRLWIGTKLGTFALDPRKVVGNPRPPTLVVNSLAAGNSLFVSPTRVELPALSTSLEIDYTATSLAMPRRVQFRYRLAGVDDDWQDAGTRRKAFYTNLGPGDYRFQVIASNEDGVWNTTGAGIDVSITPAWYQTRWFAILCVLAAITTIALLYRVRVRQVRGEIQGRLQERLLERERIARELHDTLIQGFQGLVLTFATTLRRLAPGEPRDAMEKALESAQGMLAEGRDRVQDLRDSIAFQGDLPAALKDAAADLALAHPTAFAMSVRGMRRELHPVVQEEAFLIAREALANAHRHADARQIEAEIEYGSTQFRLRIRDDGKGIDGVVLERGAPGHWGIQGMRERAQKLGGRLLVRSGAGSGAEVELDIPARVAYRTEADRDG